MLKCSSCWLTLISSCSRFAAPADIQSFSLGNQRRAALLRGRNIKNVNKAIFGSLVAGAMEMEAVESNGSHGGADRRTPKRDRRVFWACVFILANNCFQFIAYFGVSTNLVNYLKDRLHEGSKAAANGVTNWMGTCAITPLVAAFLADAFLGRYWTIALFLAISVVAYVVLAVSAAGFYAGLYLLALGSALQPVLSSFGADQFDFDDGEEEDRGRRQSSFFNWFYLSINVGSLVGGTVLVWVQSSVGWGLGYGIPVLFSVLAVAAFLAGTATYRRHQPPAGSPLTRVAQVVVAAVRKCGVQVPEDASALHECEDVDGMSAIQGSRRLAHTDQFRFLDKAAVETADDKSRRRPASAWRLCTVTQVEELKCVLRLLPVWASGIVYAAAYTQMTTTFVLQGDTLDPHVGVGFRVPAAALSVFDTLSVMLWVPLYDRLVVPLARRATGRARGLTQLARMGAGLLVLAAAMLAAGALEVARRRAVDAHTGAGGDGAYLPLSIFWQVPQYVVVGASEVFTFIGQIEFFYDQAPDALRSLCSGLSITSFALGSYVSSALVAVVARATARGGRDGWIPDDINRAHLDYFFWLLAMLCVGNFGVYLLIARWYTYKKTVD